MTRPQRIPDDTAERAADLADADASGGVRAEESRGGATRAQARADDAHRRAAAARDAAGRAVTEYARSSHLRVADMHAGLALSHEQDADALRRREGPPRS